jgi:hypothetical protein
VSFTVSVKRTKHVDLSKVQMSLRGPKKVKVGFPAGEADSDVIDRAYWNHWGTTTIPERPFLSAAMRDNRDKYRQGMKASAVKLLTGKTTISVVMSKLGIMAQGDIQESISTWVSPPNAPSTIAQKGSSQPLIDSGEMRAAVTYKIGNF